MAKPQYSGPWKRIRKQILERDSYLCQIRSPKCTGTATHVDHIVPVTENGNWWDPTNLRAACKNCNLGRNTKPRYDQWKTADTHITLVDGPPGAGKTTYVQKHAKPGDLIVDYDQIADALSGHLKHQTHRNDQLHTVTMAARNAILRQLRQGKTGVQRAWIISANPNAPTLFPYHRLITIDPGKDEVLRRIKQSDRPANWTQLVDNWYQTRNTTTADSNTLHSRQW